MEFQFVSSTMGHLFNHWNLDDIALLIFDMAIILNEKLNNLFLDPHPHPPRIEFRLFCQYCFGGRPYNFDFQNNSLADIFLRWKSYVPYALFSQKTPNISEISEEIERVNNLFYDNKKGLKFERPNAYESLWGEIYLSDGSLKTVLPKKSRKNLDEGLKKSTIGDLLLLFTLTSMRGEKQIAAEFTASFTLNTLALEMVLDSKVAKNGVQIFNMVIKLYLEDVHKFKHMLVDAPLQAEYFDKIDSERERRKIRYRSDETTFSTLEKGKRKCFFWKFTNHCLEMGRTSKNNRRRRS